MTHVIMFSDSCFQPCGRAIKRGVVKKRLRSDDMFWMRMIKR